jgi:hypothetical protein
VKRITIRIPEQQVNEVEQIVERGEFPNRSEATRTAVRDLVDDRGQPPRRAPTDGGHSDDPTDYATVFVVGGNGQTKHTFHTDPECHHLDGATVFEKDPEVIDRDLSHCKDCSGAADYGQGSQERVAAQLRSADPADIGSDLRTDGSGVIEADAEGTLVREVLDELARGQRVRLHYEDDSFETHSLTGTIDGVEAYGQTPWALAIETADRRYRVERGGAVARGDRWGSAGTRARLEVLD